MWLEQRDDIQPPQADQENNQPDDPSREANYQRELLMDYLNHVGTGFEKTGRSSCCNRSVPFRTTQFFQELLFEMCYKSIKQIL